MPAAQQVVFQQAFQTMALTSTRRSPTRRSPSPASCSHFPSAGRLVVIELAQELRRGRVAVALAIALGLAACRGRPVAPAGPATEATW